MVSIALVAQAGSTLAAAPQPSWRTIVTPHFRIYYHPGTERIATELAHTAEEVLRPLSELLGHLPDDPIHVVITDETDSANGFAQVLPYNLITLFTGVPETFGQLGDYDDYMRLLLIHELTHVVHLDTIGGLAGVVNRVLGKTLSPNSVQPRWFVEGIAVWMESKLTGAGRIESALIDTLVRTQILRGTFPAIDEVSTLMRRFPGGSVAHLFGGRFIDFVARRHGAEAIARISHQYGGRFLPYGLNIVAKEQTGEDYVQMWAAWQGEEAAKAQALLAPVRQAGLRIGCKLDDDAESLRVPRFAPDGTMVYERGPDDGDVEVMIVAPGEGFSACESAARRDVQAKFRSSGGRGALTGDGRYVAVVSDAFERRYSYRDLDIVDLATGDRRRRTFGARLFDPDVRDGQIVAVGQKAARTALYILDVDGDAPPVRVFVPPEGSDLSGAAWSPDRRTVATSMSVPGSARQIMLIDVQTGRGRPLTDGAARDISPVFTTDGAAVLFTSDRGGIFNVHRADLASGAMTQVTNVETGAFEPTIDPSTGRLIYVHATHLGYELRSMPLAPPQAELRPMASEPRTIVSSSVATALYQDEAYNPWETLIPTAYVPALSFDTTGGVLIGVTVAGRDAIGAHDYRLRLDYESSTSRVGYGFSYTNRMLSTGIRLSSSLVTTDNPGAYVAPGHDNRRLESIWRFNLGFDVNLGRWDVGSGLSMSYGVELRRGLTPVPQDPFQEAPRTQGDLTLTPLGFGWRFSNVRSFTDSISNAKGIATDVSVQVHHPLLGSDLRLVQLTTHLSTYVTMPWLDHHVLATRLAAGTSAGDSRGRAVYALGGLPARNVLTDLTDGISFGADVIRGYPLGYLRGASFFLVSAEYRVPIWTVERGIDTLPGFFDRVHGAVFFDAGETPNGAPNLDELRIGVGAELRADFVIGYFMPVRARIGYGRGLSEGAIDNVFFVLGSTF